MNSLIRNFLTAVIICIAAIQISRSGYSASWFNTVNFNDSNYLNAKDSLISPSDSLLAVQEKLTEGKTLYEKKCRRCHVLYRPKDYRLGKWKENLEEMKDKAGLTKTEYKLILGYLAANCKK